MKLTDEHLEVRVKYYDVRTQTKTSRKDSNAGLYLLQTKYLNELQTHTVLALGFALRFCSRRKGLTLNFEELFGKWFSVNFSG